jgi:hypothetical protein
MWIGGRWQVDSNRDILADSLDQPSFAWHDLPMSFAISPLSDATLGGMVAAGVWREGCPVEHTRLREVHLHYVDFTGAVHQDGKMIVLDVVAEGVAAIFRELFALKFPLASIRPIEHFGADDEQSMAANNSSAFYYRNIAGSSRISIHSYGLAIDINPLQNPCIVIADDTQAVSVHPQAGSEYLNRTNQRPGMVEPIVALFAKHGFTVWGGSWNTPIDWQHFQPARDVAERLVAMPYEQGREWYLQELCK